MASLKPPPPPLMRSSEPGSVDGAKKADGASSNPSSPDVMVDATGRSSTTHGWTVKHVSGKDAAMNAAKDEKREARETKLRAARAARADAKAGRGIVADSPEEASKARAQVQLAPPPQMLQAAPCTGCPPKPPHARSSQKNVN
jgi:hypothetical protein